MSTYYYYANPEIYILPRGKKYLFEEEKQTVDGQEETIKKCEINKILNTYKDNESYDFHLSDKRFKAIESRIYLDLWKDYSNNKFTVSKKCCIGFFKYKDSKNDFMDKEAKFNCVELLCENSNNQLQVYLSNGKDKNKDDTSKSIILNLNYEENCVKEFTIWVEYKDNAILPVESELKLKAKFYGQKEWKKEVTFTLYRNTESSLNEFKQNSENMDFDFFILPRHSPSQNQKNCIKELQIINNQVFARNANINTASFCFVPENGEIIETLNNQEVKYYEKIMNNTYMALAAFKYDPLTDEGCKSGNKIKNITTNYNFSFKDFGQQTNLIEYLSFEYENDIELLKKIIFDRNFLFGNYSSGPINSNHHLGIVNLYTDVVINFITNFNNILDQFHNFNRQWLYCPLYCDEYKRGPLTITSQMTKKLYVGRSNQVKNLAEIGITTTQNNILPTSAIVNFAKGKDENAFKKQGEDYYQVESITYNGVHEVGNNIYIRLSLEDKKLCLDDTINSNKGNYAGSSYNDYQNYGIPYYIHDYDEMSRWELNSDSNDTKKLEKEVLLNWNETDKHNWYSYSAKPNTEDFGIDCSGLIFNALTKFAGNDIKFKFTATRDDLSNTGACFFGNNNCRKLPLEFNIGTASFLTKGDVIFSSNHIVACKKGSLSSNFSNEYVSKSVITGNRKFEIVHNYGLEYIFTGEKDHNLFALKTLQGDFRHWGVAMTDKDTIEDKSHSKMGRIYLWK